jgi:multidrug efflux pump subunit AcrA (membrane-fusion protein)
VRSFVRKRRWWVVTLLVVVLAGAATGTWFLTRPSSASAASTSTVVTASRQTMTQTVATSGTIQPLRRSDLSFTVAGKVTKVSAVVGQKVSKGAVLATIDATTLQTAVDTAQAAVTSAQEQVTAVTTSSPASTATQIAAANAQLALANSQLAQANDNRAAASLTAPFTGVIAAVTMNVGDSVGSSSGSSGSKGAAGASNAGSSTTTTTDVITLISTDAWVVDVSVGSADLTQLKKGMQAQITPTGATQMVFGTVASLGIVAAPSTSGSATFPVVINVTGNPAGLYAGGSADVSIIVKQVSNVLTVPTLALRTVNGQTVVSKQVGGQSVDTVVTTGTAYGAQTEITSGLTDGDKVVVALPAGVRTRGGGGAGGTGGGIGGFGGGAGGAGGGFGGGGGGFGGGGFGGGAGAGGNRGNGG